MGLIHYTFRSEVLKENKEVYLILPTYESFRDPGQEGAEKYYEKYGRRKTLYVLHGGSDDATLYLRRTRLEEYALERGLAVVLPEVRNSFYCDMVHGKQYFTYLTEELPAVLERVFPLTDKAEERFVIGNSMGSHGAFKWALNRPDFFAAAAGMSGAGEVEGLGFFDMGNPAVEAAFGTREEYRGSRNDFWQLIRENLEQNRKLPRLYSCCGRQDFFYEGSRRFAEEATKMGCPVEFSEGDGKHEWSFWDRWLPVMIDKMMKEEV